MSEAPSFRTTRRVMAPPWLLEGDGEAIGYSLDLVKDAAMERMWLALLARCPQNDPSGETTAPTDALDAMGRDRRVLRARAGETDAEYAARLITWLDEAKRRGNPFALMSRLAEYLGPLPSFRVVDAQGNWFSRAADGTESYLLAQANWEWDAHPYAEDGRKRWSRFWVVIYPNGLWSEGAYDWGDVLGPGWGEGTETIGSSATPDEVAAVRYLVNDWKPARSRCVNIIIAFDGASFDPTAAVDAAGMPNSLWESWGRNVDGVYVPTRLSTARYWDGK